MIVSVIVSEMIHCWVNKPSCLPDAYLKLTRKAPITTSADDIHKYFHCFSEKIRLDVSARQRIHLKHQAIFSAKDKSKN